MTNDEQEIQQKNMAIEQMIKGIWRDPKSNDIWTFFEIEPQNRLGNVLIAGTGNPVPGRFMPYEIIWVNDEKIFIDLVWLSSAFRTQHQIWIDSNSIRIRFTNQNHEDSYIELVKQ